MLSRRKHLKSRQNSQNIAADVIVDVMPWGAGKNNLLEVFERSVRGEALAQSNGASIPDFVVPQTAKPQNIRKIKKLSDFQKHRGRCYSQRE